MLPLASSNAAWSFLYRWTTSLKIVGLLPLPVTPHLTIADMGLVDLDEFTRTR